MSKIELKPCLCGGKAEKIKIFSSKRYDCFYKCDTCSYMTKVYVSAQCAKNAWNKRNSRNKRGSQVYLLKEDGTIEVLPRVANWEIHKFQTGRQFISCSSCNSVIDCDYQHIDENEFDYCPYCGAKMKGGGE